MPDAYITDVPPEVPDWFAPTRRRLYDKWATITGHGVVAGPHRWACEIYHGCQTCNEHLSIPCSLAREAFLVAQFLNKDWADDEMLLFLKNYLITLDEFGSDLESVAKTLGVSCPRKPPDLVSAWCNNFAKHHLCLLIQHHPIYIMADSVGDQWPAFAAALPTSRFVDRCGNSRPLEIIDRKWFGRDRARDAVSANGERQTVVVVPPLMDFLDETITYFRAFVDACNAESELVKKFESQHFVAGCYS